MPTWTEMLGDRAIGGEKPLSMARGLEPLHAPLPLAGGLVGVLRPSVQIAVLAMFYPWEDLALSGSVAFEFVSDDHARHVSQSLEQLTKESLRRFLIPAALHQDIQHVPVLIHRPPQIVPFPLDRQKDFIHLPFVTGSETAATELIRIRLAKFAAPLTNGLIGHGYPALSGCSLVLISYWPTAERLPHARA